MKMKECPICGKVFESKGPRKYCSDRCARRAYHLKEKEKRIGRTDSPRNVGVQTPPIEACFTCPFDDCLFMRPQNCPMVNKRELTASERYHVRKARFFDKLDWMRRLI